MKTVAEHLREPCPSPFFYREFWVPIIALCLGILIGASAVLAVIAFSVGKL